MAGIRIYDKNGTEAKEGDIIRENGGNTYEVYWNKKYQYSIRDAKPNQYGAICFHGSLTSSKYIVPENLKWEIIKSK